MPLSRPLHPDQAEPLALASPHILPTPAHLPDEWKCLCAWAQEVELLAPLWLLFDATGAIVRPGAIGSILHFVVRPNILDELELWAAESAAADVVYQIAAKLKMLGEQVLKLYRPLPDAQAARTRFAGDLEYLYLFALLATRNPHASGDLAARADYDRLRLWTLVHAVERAEQGILLDTALRDVASKLRLAGDGKVTWLDTLAALRLTARSFLGLDAQVFRRTTTLIQSQRGLEPSNRAFLRALCSVALREDHAVDSGSRSRLFNGASKHIRVILPNAAEPASLVMPDDDDETPVEIETVRGLGDDYLVSVPVPQDITLTGQIKYASSILLNSVEENQFLPWTWSRITPSELRNINAWMAKALKEGDVEDQSLAAVLWVAMATGRSLARALAIKVSHIPDEEWSITPAMLLRQAVRPSRAWRPEERHGCWIRPLSNSYELPLPADVAEVFRARLVPYASSPAILGALFAPKPLLSRFREIMAMVAPRVTAGMFTNLLPWQLYLSTGDAVLARLYARHPNTGLPGAAAYPSWTGAELTNTLLTSGLPAPSLENFLTANVLGSRLDPIEALIRAEIRKAAAALRRKRNNDVVDFHNALTSYILVALQAATGARPVRAPFESVVDFDFEERFVFVADKLSGLSRSGRLVPLPKVLSDFIALQYVPYLRSLAAWIERSGDSELGLCIRNATNRTSSGEMPFFFFLQLDGRILRWISFSEMTIASLGLFAWPLPLRHFRHRLARKLRTALIDPEVIDGILGHCERGSSAYGDRSTRIWLEDIAGARPVMDECFASLGFRPIRIAQSLERAQLCNFEPIPVAERNQALFGRAERARLRGERFRAGVRGAGAIIDGFCNGRSLGDLNSDEIDQLSRALVFNKNGIPHAMGALRYSVLLRRLERAQDRQTRTVRVRHVYLAFVDEPSTFTNMATGAIAAYRKLVDLLEQAPVPEYLPRAMGQALTLGVLRLVIETRLTDVNALKDILAGRNYRLVGLNNRTYIEFGENIADAGPAGLCRRLEVSHATARLLSVTLAGKRPNDAGKRKVDGSLRSMAECVQSHLLRSATIATVSQLVAAIAALVDQLNAITRPGIVAGFLAGRVKSLSLNWYDFTRLQDGCLRDFSALGADENSNKPILALTPNVPSTAKDPDVPLDQREMANRKLLRDVAHALNEKATKNSLTREARFSAIEELAIQASGSATPFVCLLAHWVAHLMLRHNQKSREQYLTLATIERYLAALTKGFAEVAPANDVEDFDEDEITEIYTGIVDAVPARSQRYSRLRLEEFHSWLSLQKPVEDPDWSLVPGSEKSLAANPGVISEVEYLNIIRHLVGADSGEMDKQSAFVLLLAYRFGLRTGESVGLLRGDIVGTPEGEMVVAVCNNRLRKLKTKKSSRRLVPLVARLSCDEIKLINYFVARSEAQAGDNLNYPIFGAEVESASGRVRRALTARLRRAVIPIIKCVTGNPRANLHLARHSAGNVVAACLFDVDFIGLHTLDKAARTQVRELLLGRMQVTRRALPAVERYLGHAGAGTTQEYYLHLLDIWANQLNSIAPTEKLRAIDGLKNLDDAPRYCAVLTRDKINNLGRRLSVADGLMYLRLRARGFACEEAVNALNFDEAAAKLIDERLELVANKFRFSVSSRELPFSRSIKQSSLSKLIARISDRGWNEWIEWAGIRSKAAVTPCGASSLYLKATTSRQFVIWSVADLESIKRHLDWWGIGSEQLLVVHSTKCGEKLLSAAKALGFEVKDARKSNPPVQVDAVRTGEDGEFLVDQRVAFLIRETDHAIRHAAEFLMSIVVSEVMASLRHQS